MVREAAAVVCVGALTSDTVTFLFYDQPEYDVFWQMVIDLDVPVYFHPRTNPDPVGSLLYGHSKFLRGPIEEFAVTLSNHIMGLCTNGVFEYVMSIIVVRTLTGTPKPIPEPDNPGGTSRRTRSLRSLAHK